jgi:hypothetical protein
MSDTSAPIELAPRRRARAPHLLHGIRAAGRWLHQALALAVVFGVFVQVYLIGSYIFGAGQGALDAHRTAGWTVHGFELLVLLAALIAWLPRVDLVLSLLLAVTGTIQVSLANGHRWVGGLHPLLALAVLGLAATLALRGTRRRRDARLPRPPRPGSARAPYRTLIGGGILGSCVGVIGASISDPRVGFPAWVDLTGLMAGFGLGVLVTGTARLLRRT